MTVFNRPEPEPDEFAAWFDCPRCRDGLTHIQDQPCYDCLELERLTAELRRSLAQRSNK